MVIFHSYVKLPEGISCDFFSSRTMTPLAEEQSGATELSARQGARHADVGMVRISADESDQGFIADAD